MKSKFLLPVIILLLCSITSFAQGDKVGDRLHKLFILCFTDNFKVASKYIVYRGSDTSRIWKDVYNYENEEERKSVVDICIRIKNYLLEGGDYELTEFSEDEESEGIWYTWLVEFVKGKHRKVRFSFLKIGKKYALGDID